MSSSLRRLTRCAVLTALALALSVAEGLVPLTILFPLPGLRLGLANLVTVYALCRLSGREALLILAARCLLGALLGGNLMALAFSLTGGLLAFGVMALLLRCSFLSLFGVSIAGAAATTPARFWPPWQYWAAGPRWCTCRPCCSAPWSPGPSPAARPCCWFTGFPFRVT